MHCQYLTFIASLALDRRDDAQCISYNNNCGELQAAVQCETRTLEDYDCGWATQKQGGETVTHRMGYCVACDGKQIKTNHAIHDVPMFDVTSALHAPEGFIKAVENACAAACPQQGWSIRDERVNGPSIAGCACLPSGRFADLSSQFARLGWHKDAPVQKPTTTAVEEPTTAVGEPTTAVGEPTTVVEEPTTVVEEPTTVVEEPTTVVGEPTTVVEEPTTIVEVPTTIVEEPTTIVNEPTTVVEEPTTIVEEPTTIVNKPTTVVEEPVSTSTGETIETIVVTAPAHQDEPVSGETKLVAAAASIGFGVVSALLL
ncbi:uncharacterized protein EV422DRAFT_531022, partial [Fimicolochytrium jonesii]|uniref:uncharacterized protein n=1 Tax=Fimicolochytrium jonesii TaxID=1396493 RepID=UPI0022FE6CD5